MAEIKEATVLEAVPNDTVVVDKCTGEKMILLGFTNHAILAGKDGKIRVRDLQDVKVLLSDEQKKLLERGLTWTRTFLGLPFKKDGNIGNKVALSEHEVRE